MIFAVILNPSEIINPKLYPLGLLKQFPCDNIPWGFHVDSK